MTTTPETKLYETLPFEASSTDFELAGYGEHPVPEDEGDEIDFDMPGLIAQYVTEDLPAVDMWEKWGRKGRTDSHINGAWHHFASDAKFATLLRNPNLLIDTGAIATIEVNVTTSVFDPFPVALSGMWRKRCLSRVLQDAGIQVFVDMNVEGHARDLLFVGVPEDHSLYATKYQKATVDGHPVGVPGLIEDWEAVREHVADDIDPLFVVYGGSRTIEELCNQNGWLWLPSAGPKAQQEKEAG